MNPTNLQIHPYPCTRCGYCCLIQPCKASISLGLVKNGSCVMLDFGRTGHDVATCNLAMSAPDHVGIGHGCEVKAYAYLDDIQYDFAMIEPRIKRSTAVRLYIENSVRVALGKKPVKTVERKTQPAPLDFDRITRYIFNQLQKENW